MSVIIYSCYFDKEEELYPNSNCDTANITFSANISKTINNKCATSGCHVAGGISPNLTSYNNIKASIDRIKIRAVDARTMPPASSPKLTDCEHKQLNTWISNGSPNN